MGRLYVVRVEIREEASRYAYPIVVHLFCGRTRKEARGYHAAHKKADAFLRACEGRGRFGGGVRCRARITEGWRGSR